MARWACAAAGALLLAALLAAPAAGQAPEVAAVPELAADSPLISQSGVAAGPEVLPADSPLISQSGVGAAEAPGNDLSTTIGSGGESVPVAAAAPGTLTAPTPNNRTVGTQLVIPPSGCLIITVTAEDGRCLQDASFQVNNQSIARPSDLRAAGLDPSQYNATAYNASNANCASSNPAVTQLYESEGCALLSAVTSARDTATAQNIENSFVCEQGTDTTNFARAFGSTAADRRVCSLAAAAASDAITARNATSRSGNPCTASRALYLITNPCPNFNTVVNTTARFFLGEERATPPPPARRRRPPPAEAPEPVDEPLGAPEPADEPAGEPDANEPAGQPSDEPANEPSAADEPSGALAPAPEPQSAMHVSALGAVASVIAAAAVAAVL